MTVFNENGQGWKHFDFEIKWVQHAVLMILALVATSCSTGDAEHYYRRFPESPPLPFAQHNRVRFCEEKGSSDTLVFYQAYAGRMDSQVVRNSGAIEHYDQRVTVYEGDQNDFGFFFLQSAEDLSAGLVQFSYKIAGYEGRADWYYRDSMKKVVDTSGHTKSFVLDPQLGLVSFTFSSRSYERIDK